MASMIFRIREEDKEGMTLADLADFVENARSLGAEDDCVIKGRVTVRGRLRSLEAEADTQPGGGYWSAPGQAAGGVRHIFPEPTEEP